MDKHDVIIIGAGPAGCTAAACLAKKGVDTLIIEAATFPRFMIGESLLPCAVPVFEHIGFDVDPARYQHKPGAKFFNDDDGRTSTFGFGDGLPGTPDHAYHVERAIFDLDLLNHAVGLGARARQGTKVERVNFHDDYVEVDLGDERAQAKFVIDASGRRSVLGKQQRSLRPIRGFGIASAFAHFTDIPESFARDVDEDGSVMIVAHEHGWGWMIPLKGPTISIGLVVNKKNISTSWFEDYIRQSRYFAPIVRDAKASETQLVGNFSFINDKPHGSRFASVGDAASFLDPVFSSGVSVGMVAAQDVAARLCEGLQAGTEAEPELMAEHRAEMTRVYETFGSAIHRFYNTRIVDNLFFATDADPETKAGVITVLAGDVWRRDNPYQNGILRGRHHWQLGTGTTASGIRSSNANKNIPPS